MQDIERALRTIADAADACSQWVLRDAAIVERQTQEILTAVARVPKEVWIEMLMLYAMDPKYEREAICRASQRLQQRR
jgi:hypothetical protein